MKTIRFFDDDEFMKSAVNSNKVTWTEIKDLNVDNLIASKNCSHHPIKFKFLEDDIEAVSHWTEQEKYALYEKALEATKQNLQYRDKYKKLITKFDLTTEEYKMIFELTKPWIAIYLATNALSSRDVESLEPGKYLYADGMPITDVMSIISIAYKKSSERFTIAARYEDDLRRIINTADALQVVGYIDQTRRSMRLKAVIDDTGYYQYPEADVLNQNDILYVSDRKLVSDIPFAARYIDSENKLANRKMLFFETPIGSFLTFKFNVVECDVVRSMFLAVDKLARLSLDTNVNIDELDINEVLKHNDGLHTKYDYSLSDFDFFKLSYNVLLKYAKEDLVNQRDIYYKVRTNDLYKLDVRVLTFCRLINNKLQSANINTGDFRSNNKTVMSVTRLATYGSYLMTEIRRRCMEESAKSDNDDSNVDRLLKAVTREPIMISTIKVLTNDMIIFDSAGKGVINNSEYFTILQNDRLSEFVTKNVLNLKDVVRHEYSGYESNVYLDYEDLATDLKALEEHQVCFTNAVKDLLKIVITKDEFYSGVLDSNNPTRVAVIGPTNIGLILTEHYAKTGFENTKELADIFKDDLASGVKSIAFGEDLDSGIKSKSDKINMKVTRNVYELTNEVVTDLFTDKLDKPQLVGAMDRIVFLSNKLNNLSKLRMNDLGITDVYIVDPIRLSSRFVADVEESLDSNVDLLNLQAAHIKHCLDCTKICFNGNIRLHFSRNISEALINRLFAMYDEVYVNDERRITIDDHKNLVSYFDKNIKKKRLTLQTTRQRMHKTSSGKS